MKISAIVVLVGEGCENFSARQITLRDLVTLANVISFNDIGASMGSYMNMGPPGKRV